MEKSQAQFFVTDKCDLKCVGCPIPDQQNMARPEMDPRQWAEITDQLYSEGCRLYCVIGGEPASYPGLVEVLRHLTCYPDTSTILSTSGYHLLKDLRLRKAVGKALSRPSDNPHNNGLAFSFDAMPMKIPHNSREFKSGRGLDLVDRMQAEFPNQMVYVANTMLYPGNIDQIMTIYELLSTRGVYLNLCTQQNRCFGGKPVFPPNDSRLQEIGRSLMEEKAKGGLIANSMAYLSRLDREIGQEEYRCYEENCSVPPVLDVDPSGNAVPCYWRRNGLTVNQQSDVKMNLLSGELNWEQYWTQAQTTLKLCPGCSWSRRDRRPGMVELDPNCAYPPLPNLWG